MSKPEFPGDGGLLMTLEEFIDSCGSLFIDYDGFGCYATETEMFDEEIIPSDVKKGKINYNYTHVVWFNR